MSSLLSDLRAASSGGATAVRIVTRLVPAGGPHDKVFPPTYAEGKYATENRWVASREVRTVLLDSVQSQANRLEAALKVAWEADEIELPMLCVDIPHHGRITALDAPHRAADAIFRDSRIGSTLFRDTEPGRAFVSAKPTNAAPLLGVCPTALVFGQWDSTAGAGTLGAKFQRVLVSEVVGYEAVPGTRTSSRIDPLQISKVDLAYASDEEYWTPDESKAKRDDKGKPIKMKPSEINHGNVTPSIDEEKGGFTIGWAEQITVLSFPALRRLRFPVAEGQPSSERDIAGRTVVAALALHAALLTRDDGYDLRSRCLLIPESTRSEWLGTSTADVRSIPLDRALTGATLKEAIAAARAAGLSWSADKIMLVPSEKLLGLVRASHGE